MRSRWVTAGVTLVLALLAVPRAGHADGAATRKPILVLESHVGKRPAEVSKLLEALGAALETHGFAARPATLLQIAGSAVPRPGRLDRELTQAQLAQRLGEAWAMFGEAQWEDASKALTKVLDEVRRNPALVVYDTTNLDLTFRAYVALAVCHQRRLDASAAGRTMLEAIRTFPSRPVSRAEAWGKEGEKLYLDYSKQAQAMGRGRLVIAAGDAEAQIFVEGQLRGVRNVSLTDLVPGVYRVFVRLPREEGKQYDVQVIANDDAYLEVDPQLDNALRVSEAWVGFQFATEAARESEARFAHQIARRWTGGGPVVVLATSQDKGRPVLDGIRYKKGVEVRRARIYTDGSDAEGPKKLAQFLVDGTSSGGIEVLRSDAVAPQAAAGRAGWRTRSKVVLATGAFALAASGVVFALRPNDPAEPTVEYNGRDYAAYASLGGAAVVGAGVYLWMREGKRTRVATALVSSAGVASLVAGIALVATDEDADDRFQYFRDTMTEGLIAGGVGVALTGVGAWLYYRDRRGLEAAAMPVVSVERHGALVGWSGRF